MSLWYCSEHGLYGGDCWCPVCGEQGGWVEFPREEGAVEKGRMPDEEWEKRLGLASKE